MWSPLWVGVAETFIHLLWHESYFLQHHLLRNFSSVSLLQLLRPRAESWELQRDQCRQESPQKQRWRMCVVVRSALGGWRSVSLGEGGLGVGGGGRFPLSRTHLESVSRNVFFGRQKIGLFLWGAAAARRDTRELRRAVKVFDEFTATVTAVK